MQSLQGADLMKKKKSPEVQLSLPFTSARDSRVSQVRKIVEEVFERLAKKYRRGAHALPAITFDLKGRAAGRAYPRQWKLRFNMEALEKYPEETSQTVGHEACHLYSVLLYGERVQAHGQEWRKVMKDAGFTPKRCHSMELTPARIVKKFGWVCLDCERVYYVGPRRNASLKRAKLTCNHCRRKGFMGQLKPLRDPRTLKKVEEK